MGGIYTKQEGRKMPGAPGFLRKVKFDFKVNLHLDLQKYFFLCKFQAGHYSI